ncbi:hypothetical protein [Salinactinospora qingdaonensis]|uniref:SCP-2 sterol transfer family protein n=1 Tax=Salinactinospora qingdaonensis TaxID=702744 RepID=A0ABP7GH10_9ACTN
MAFRSEAARGVHLGYELHVDGSVIHTRVDNARLATGRGRLADADLHIEAGPRLHALLSGELRPGEAVDNGEGTLVGNRELLARFVEIFTVRPR